MRSTGSIKQAGLIERCASDFPTDELIADERRSPAAIPVKALLERTATAPKQRSAEAGCWQA